MKFLINFSLFAIQMILCWNSPPPPLLLDKLAAIEIEMEAVQPLFPSMIKLFFALKYFYKRFKCFEYSESDYVKEPVHFSKLRSVLSKYYICIVSFYTNSPLESLRAVRLYGNFEFALLFAQYVAMTSKPPSLPDLENPFWKILIYKEEFEIQTFPILYDYDIIGETIYNEPFMALARALPDNAKDSKMTTQTGSYTAIIEWEERKELLEEIILSIRAFNTFARHFIADMSGFLIKVKNKMENLEFVRKNFRVDSQGPSLNHFISLFYQLQSLVQDFKLYEDLPSTTKKLFYLFKVYWHHLIQNQMTDPLLFPKKMLALIALPNFEFQKTKFTSLLKLPTNDILKKSLKYLQRGDITGILYKERENPISEIYKPQMNSEYSFLDLGKGLWNNLLLHGDILTPYEQWKVKTYLILQYEMAKMAIKLEEKVFARNGIRSI
jgi:hypothetical protein